MGGLGYGRSRLQESRLWGSRLRDSRLWKSKLWESRLCPSTMKSRSEGKYQKIKRGRKENLGKRLKSKYQDKKMEVKIQE